MTGEVTRLKKDIGRGSREVKKEAELQTKHDKSGIGVQALERKNSVLQFWRSLS